MKTNWAIYIEGMCLPWQDGITKSDAEDYAKEFKKNGIMAAAQRVGYTHRTRYQGRNVVKK